MVLELRGSRQEGDVWIKAEGRGVKSGFKLKSELEEKDAKTLPKILEISAAKFDNLPSIGTRKLLNRSHIKEKEGSKVLEKLTLGEYEWMTYGEMQEKVCKIASYIQFMGFNVGDKIGILAETRAEWLLSALACLKCGLTLVTLYSNLADSGFIHALNETEVTSVITSFEIYPRLAKILPECKSIKNIIVFEDQLEGLGKEQNISKDIKVIPFSEILKSNLENQNNFPNLSKDDEAIIMYTSGSTGRPKGVIITHENIYSSLIGYVIQANLGSNDRYIAYLPLAHVMELLTEMALIAIGVTIAYSSPMTLTNNSPKIKKGTLGDARVAEPTSMTAVPLILDRVIKAVTQSVERQGKMKTKIFKEALRYKEGNGTSFTSKILDAVIFKKVKAELGGKIKMMVVGGAPLSPQTYSLIRAMFGCTLQIGYGCTETTASACSTDADDFRCGSTGPPNPFVKIRLVSWEEGDYRTTDSPKPRGEIHVGGPVVAKGYFKLENEDKEAFYEEDGIRWFKTGDIGEFDETGVLYVIDRKKDLVKLNHGEYISLGNVETKLKTSSLVDNICVFADPTENHAIAIIVPSHDAYKKLAQDNNIDCDLSMEKLCLNAQGIEVFLEKIKLHAKQCGLGRWDVPQKICLSSKAWNPENGLVTAGMKLKRLAVHKEYEEQIKSMYNKT